MELCSSNIKKFLIFSQKKAFLIFREIETPKKLLMFQKTKLSYITGAISKAPKATISYIFHKNYE